MNDLTVCNTTIRQDSEGRYCLNDLHKAAGGEKKHQPTDFLRTDQAAGLVNELKEIPGNPGISPVHSRQKAGTYVVKELVYAYAMWISPAFHLRVIRAYDALVVHGNHAQEKSFHIPQTMSEALRLAADLSDQNAKMAEELEENRPKVEFYDVVSQSEQEVTVSEAAKILGTGEKRLWQLLRDRGYVLKNSTAPAQRWVEKGFFSYKITSYLTPGGFRGSNTTTLVTGKGIAYLQRNYFRVQGEQLKLRYNPRPAGSLLKGAAPERVMNLLRSHPGRNFSESEIVSELGQHSRSSVSFALQRLRFFGVIESIPSPVSARNFVWRIRNQATAH